MDFSRLLNLPSNKNGLYFFSSETCRDRGLGAKNICINGRMTVFLPSLIFIFGGGVFDSKSWKKTGAVASIFSLIPGREASTEYEPCWPGKVFSHRHTGLYCTLSLVYLYRMYSMMVILPMHNCSQVQTGYVSAPPPYKLSYIIH